MKIQVKVKANSKIQEFSQESGHFIAKVKEPPKAGRANQAVIELLAEHFEVHKSQVRILSGFKSKNKIIEVIDR